MVDKDILSIGSPNAGTALVKGIKEGMVGLKLSCNGLVGGTTYNPTSSVTVRRVRLESLSLSPENADLGQPAAIRGRKSSLASRRSRAPPGVSAHRPRPHRRS